VTRLIPGALGNENSTMHESFGEAGPRGETQTARSDPSDSQVQARPAGAGLVLPRDDAAQDANRGILDCPHYTRPPNFRGWDVPEVLLGGNHEEIRRWRRKRALEKTLRNRPDLLAGAALSDEDRRLLLELHARSKAG
jgi:tRNA (guanine37-N1)-methyltransferase